MNTFGWKTRLKYALLAAGTAWLAGWLITLPFELALARRYADGDARLLHDSLAKGLAVWGGFSLFMALAGFVPLVLPVFLLLPPRWMVRLRYVLIPAAPLGALLAIYNRMGFLHAYRLHHRQELKNFFFTAPNIFVITFALAVVWVYVVLAQRRLRTGPGQVRAKCNSN
jgi:hypothetical protein